MESSKDAAQAGRWPQGAEQRARRARAVIRPLARRSIAPRGAVAFPFRFYEFLVGLALALALAVAVLPGHFRRLENVKLARAMDRMRETSIAIENYYVDHEAFPASGAAAGAGRKYGAELFWTPDRPARVPAGVPTINSFAPAKSGAARLVTFRVPSPGGLPATLTTPVAYLSHFSEDPFASTRGTSFGYFAHASQLGWILTSFGPDRDENAPGGPGDVSARVEVLYDVNDDFPGLWRPRAELAARMYDPTNGTWSGGDLCRMPNLSGTR